MEIDPELLLRVHDVTRQKEEAQINTVQQDYYWSCSLSTVGKLKVTQRDDVQALSSGLFLALSEWLKKH